MYSNRTFEECNNVTMSHICLLRRFMAKIGFMAAGMKLNNFQRNGIIRPEDISRMLIRFVSQHSPFPPQV